MKSGVQPEYALVAWAARKLQRPVRWISDRTEGFLTDEQAREMRITRRLGAGCASTIHRAEAAMGRESWRLCLRPIRLAGRQYRRHRRRLPHPDDVREVCGVLTNTVPTAAYRGAGRPEATYTIERIIDVAARELGISPYELRRRNLIPPEAMPYKTALTFTYDCGEFEGNMRKAAELADLAASRNAGRRPKRGQAARHRPVQLHRGRRRSVPSPGQGPRDAASGRGRHADPAIRFDVGGARAGDDVFATCRRPLRRADGQVRWEGGDTDLLASGKGNGGSGALCIGGSAVSLAMDKVIEKCGADRRRVARGRCGGHRISMRRSR